MALSSGPGAPPRRPGLYLHPMRFIQGFFPRPTPYSRIAKETVVAGRVFYSGTLHIDGWIKGSVLATQKQSDTLILGKSARVDGKIDSRWLRLF